MIQARGLTKRYGPAVAVDDLTFEVTAGRVTGFLGPNGADKSTTMRLILGLDAPTGGSVTVGGRCYRSVRRPLHEVGSMLESAAIHPGRSARAHLLALAAAGSMRCSPPPGWTGWPAAGGFSLGMTQWLGVAAALLGDPPVLLLDEPVKGLDPDGVAWIRGLLKAMAAEGRAIFVSSHLMSEMENTADHLIVIGRGKLIADAPLAEFTLAAAAVHVQLRSPQQDLLAWLLQKAGTVTGPGPGGSQLVTGASAAEVGDLAARHGIAPHELLTRKPSLEEAFTKLTRDAVQYRPHEQAMP